MTGLVQQAAAVLQLQPGVVWALGGLVGALTVGSVVRLALLTRQPVEQRLSRMASLRTWWILALLFGSALLLGRAAAAMLFMIVSLFGLREYLALTYEARRDRVADLIALAAVPLHYVLILEGSNGEWLIFLPTLMFLLLAVRLVLTGTTSGFVYDVSSVFWGLMLTTFCVSFAVRLAVLPDEYNPVGHWAGWMFFLIILTEINDIAQALWGRKFGRHKVTPTVSPHKTWEGLLFGMATTIVAAVLLAPLLTPLGSARFFPAFFPGQWSIVAGLIIALGGFFGDVTVSAVKRDMGVKDSSRLLPGQGGMLDRIDSLSFTAPLFYHFILVLHSWKESPAAP